MTWRQLFGLAAVGAGVAIVTLIWSSQPERQVLRAFENLIHQVENRKWDKVQSALSPHYLDQWGLSGEEMIHLASEGFRQFFTVEITPDTPVIQVNGKTAVVKVHLQLRGRGTALAEAAIARANELHEPFVLTWRRESSQPWDWRLASVSQSEIYLPSNSWE